MLLCIVRTYYDIPYDSLPCAFEFGKITMNGPHRLGWQSRKVSPFITAAFPTCVTRFEGLAERCGKLKLDAGPQKNFTYFPALPQPRRYVFWSYILVADLNGYELELRFWTNRF